MRYLGLDLGTKTLGVALSDTTLTIASPLKTIFFEENNYDSVIPEIEMLIKDYNISKIVLGLPKNMNNSIGPRGETTLMFAELLRQKLDIEVIMQDERLSTVEATNYLLEGNMSRKKRKQHVDTVAAVIILETYLNRERR